MVELSFLDIFEEVAMCQLVFSLGYYGVIKTNKCQGMQLNPM